LNGGALMPWMVHKMIVARSCLRIWCSCIPALSAQRSASAAPLELIPSGVGCKRLFGGIVDISTPVSFQGAAIR
jgi:hypothetical protein